MKGKEVSLAPLHDFMQYARVRAFFYAGKHGGKYERKKNVRAFYNKTAQQWAGKWYEDDVNLPLLREFLKLLPANPRVLDLCCGARYDSMRLQRLGAKVVGLDFSEESITIARVKNSEISFYVGNMLEDYGQIGTVDAIICLVGLVHLPVDQLRTVFTHMAEVMNTGGSLLLMVRDGEGRVDRMSDVVIDGETYDRAFFAHSLAELKTQSEELFVFDREIRNEESSIWVNYVFKYTETIK